MKLSLEIRDEAIDIIYDGYNIIAKTIFNEELAKKIYNLIQAEIYENLADLTELVEILNDYKARTETHCRKILRLFRS